MSSNFEWQKFQTNERVRDRLREAEAQRRATRARGSLPVRVLPGVLLLLGTGILVAVMLWTGLGG